MKYFLKMGMVTVLCSLFFLMGPGIRALKAEPAIDFTLQTLDGKDVTLSSLKGKKVLIDFFATWCPPCREELKEINEIVTEYKNGNYEILCVSVDNSQKTVERFMEKNKYRMTVLFDVDQQVSRQYRVSGIPSLFLIDENGDLVWHQAGALPKEDLMKLLGIEE